MIVQRTEGPDARGPEPELPDALPEVNEGRLDREALTALARDVEALCEVLAVIPKAGPRAHASPRQLGLSEGMALFAAGELRGLQLRYRHEGQEWWDTLIAAGPDRYRLVRIAAPV